MASAVPGADEHTQLAREDALVEVRNASKHFLPSRIWRLSGSQITKAVDGVSLSIPRGSVYGLVGESGSGKTTLGRLVLGLETLTSGTIYFGGRDVATLRRRERRRFRQQVQLVFQNPFSALNPRRSIQDSLSVGLEVHNLGGDKRSRRIYLIDLLSQVGLGADALKRYPHEFSGGQLQRIVIARALSVKPTFIVADEPVSALDVSIQAQVLNLLRDLQRSHGFTMLLISHDLRVIYHMSDQIGVMYLGRLVERATRRELYDNPLHPYTRGLIASAPRIEGPGGAVALRGELWDQRPPDEGCVFAPRCPLAIAPCWTTIPSLEAKRSNHAAACIRVSPEP